MFKNNELVVTENIVLFNHLNDSIKKVENNISLNMTNQKNIFSDQIERNYIDLLIIDQEDYLQDTLNLTNYIKLSNNIIFLQKHLNNNCLNELCNKFCKNLIITQKPFRLSSLLDTVKSIRKNYNKYVYFLFNNIIFSEKNNYIQNLENDIVIKLTNLESSIIAYLFKSPNFSCEKDSLINILSCHVNFEMHIYRMKKKLPKQFLSYNNGILKIST